MTNMEIWYIHIIYTYIIYIYIYSWCSLSLDSNFIVETSAIFGVTPPEVWHRPWKMVVGRLLSYWEGSFSGTMFNFGRVPIHLHICQAGSFISLTSKPQLISWVSEKTTHRKLAVRPTTWLFGSHEFSLFFEGLRKRGKPHRGRLGRGTSNYLLIDG